MITQVIHCLYCQGINLVKNGKTPQGKQCYQCRKTVGDGRTFILSYAYPGQCRKVKQQIVAMALNGSGIRDTAREISGGIIHPETLSRVLHVSTSTVIKELKKKQPNISQ